MIYYEKRIIEELLLVMYYGYSLYWVVLYYILFG